MKQVAVVGAVVLSGCLISPVIPIGSGKSSNEVQHEGLGKLFPAQLTASARWKGEIRVAKVRVWADDEYRAQNVRWQHGFDEQLDYANQVFTPMLGVRIEAEYRTWERHAPGATLQDALAELTALDTDQDAVWIVGLTSSLTLASGSFDLLGLANLEDRHVVLRGHADLEERKAFERVFPDINREQRESVLEARRRHKTTCVLIHELAHSLGALHETEPGWVMNAGYSHQAAQISDRNRELMLITIEDRLKPTSARDPRGTAQRLLAALEVAWGGWDAEDRTTLIDGLRAQLGTQAAVGIAGIPAPVQNEYRHAQQLLAGGDHGGALAVLDPLLAAYPAHAELRLLGCQIELARGGARDAKAIAACDRAAGLARDPEIAIHVAAARLGAGDTAGGRATLAAVEERLANLPQGQAASTWLVLAKQYRKMDAVTWAEDALAKAGVGPGADEDLARWIAVTRVRYGVPRDGARWKLVPEDDPAAVVAVHAVLDAANVDRFADAKKAADIAEKRWPGLPGLLAARCDLAFRRRELGAARQYCTRAIAHGKSSWALYLLGVIELQNDGRAAMAAGIARLREAIELDPDLGHAWRALGKAYVRTNATAERDQLRREYYARFHAAM
jgi:tetratricopeptide (TPR) repeat protein